MSYLPTNLQPVQPQLSYYEQSRKKYSQIPFDTDAEKIEFQIQLNNWGDYCNKNRQACRSKYIVSEYSTLDMVVCDSFKKIEVANSGNHITNILFWSGSVEKVESDATVNAANETLLGGGGVDYAIHQAAGKLLLKECAHIKGGCNVGEAKITKGYRLPANYVLHTVGPILGDGGNPEAEMLASCYRSCLEMSKRYNLKSIVFPCISTGFYGFPKLLAAEVAIRSVKTYIEQSGDGIETVIFSLPEKEQQEAYTAAFALVEDKKYKKI